jgi:GrpB-like predicted nucleotidyltransferase (UPF0157 family)
MEHELLFRLVDADSARERAKQLFAEAAKSLAAILPPTVDIWHIGATAIPDCLTKGDVDIVVRVPAEDFDTADSILATQFTRNEGSIRTTSFSAFEDATKQPHLGIQLTVVDGPFDFFHLFIERLQQSPRLIEEYNTLKRLYDGGDMSAYRAAKDAFVERVLANCPSRQ